MALSQNLIFSIVFLVTFVFQTQGQFFTRGPSNLTVYEGQDATFTSESPYAVLCNPRYFVKWYRSAGHRGVAGCSPTSEFSGNGQYWLTIPNAQLEDSGEYWCELVFGDPYYQVRQPSRATLTVLPLPKNNPSCTFEPTRPTVGTVTTLACGLSSYDSSSLLTWYESQLSFSNRLGYQHNTQPGQVYYIERVLTEADNMREFTCIAGPYLNGPSCSITPLQIPTTVSISPSHLTLHEHENATFTCDFKSTPRQIADRYKWRVLKDGIPEVEVNQEVLQNLEGRFELENGGRSLQIINVTLEEFHNAQIGCIAFYNGTNYTSNNKSLLDVYPMTSMATDQSLTTTATERNSDENNAINSAGSSTVFIVGGILGAIFFLITITLLGCYLIKYKHNPTGPGQSAVTRKQNPPVDKRVTVTNEDESGPMYDQIPVEETGEQNSQIPSDFTTHAEVLYASPDETGPEIRRSQGCSVAMADLTNSLTYTELTRDDGEPSEPSPYQSLCLETIYSN